MKETEKKSNPKLLLLSYIVSIHTVYFNYSIYV